MYVGPPSRESPRTVEHQARTIEHHANERRQRSGLAATCARALWNVTQDETSDSQLIARCRSRARSPMSMPVVVAIDSIGVLIRSSGE